MPKGLLDRKSEDVTITRKLPNGASVTYKSPQDSQMDMDGILGGMIDGYTPTPVSDNKQINVTPGEFVVNQPAAQKYKGLLEKINDEGRVALAAGGWTSPKGKMNYADGGTVEGPRGGMYKKVGANWIAVLGNREFPVKDPSVVEWLNNRYGNQPTQTIQDAQPLSRPNLTPTKNAQQYPERVVLDPNSSDKAGFDRMDQLVRGGLYDIQRDRAGRAIYSRTDLGNAQNVAAVGSGVRRPGVTQGSPVENYHQFSGVSADPVGDNALANIQSQGLQGRGNVVEAPGAREDYLNFGPATQAPTHGPRGSAIRYKAGQSYNVGSKQQAAEFVAAGIVAVGATFVLPDGTTGVAG